jgi:hypothetical protein
MAITREQLASYAVAFVKHVPEWLFYQEAVAAMLLLIAACGLLLNRLVTNCVALAIGGFFFYHYAIWSFWILADNAEVPRFSAWHFSLWYPNLHAGQLLQIGLSATIFCVAAYSMRWKQGRNRA